MTEECEEIDLPVFCRQVAVTHGGGGSGEGKPPRPVRRILHRFSGVLGVGVTVGDWPPPALSYLTLNRLAAAALADSEGGRRPASKGTRSTTDTDTGTDTNTAEEESEPRVREVIRDDSSSARETSPRLDSPRIAAPGQLAADESSPGPGVDPPGTDEERVPEQTVGRESGRNPGDDDRPGDREFGPARAPSTVAGSRARQRSVPAMTVLRAAPRVLTHRPDRPDSVPESGLSRPRGGRDRMEGRTTGFERSPRGNAPSLAGSDAGDADTGIRMEPLETPIQAPGPTGVGIAGPGPTIVGTGEGRVGPGDGEGPRMTVRRNEGPGGVIPGDAADGDRSGGRTDATDADGSQTGGPPRGNAGRAGRSNPRTIGGPGIAEPGPATAGTGEDSVNSDYSRRPRMTVHRDERSSGLTGGYDAGGDRSAGRTDVTDADGSQTGQSPRGNVDREGTSNPQLIDDLIDVDRLVDRLMRAFERKARIERERRGR